MRQGVYVHVPVPFPPPVKWAGLLGSGVVVVGERGPCPPTPL